LEARREKLRDLVLTEETNLTREIVEEVQRSNDARLEEMRAKTEELRKRRDEEREAIVAAKRMQQYLRSCQNIQQTYSKRATIDVKRCNVVQMTEHETRRSEEMELEALWHRLMMAELEAKKREEEEESARRASVQREVSSVLAKQVEDKLMLVEEEKRIMKKERENLELLWEEVRQTERRNLEIEQQKRKELRRQLEEQMLSAKRFLAERTRLEAAVDQEFRMLADKEIAAEKERVEEDVESYRKEIAIYFKYLEDLRQEEARRNMEVETIVQQSYEDAETRRRLALSKFREARERLLQDVLRGRDEQLREKQEALEEERRLKVEEREDLEKQAEMYANLDAIERQSNREKALRYALELKEQHEKVEAAKRRELEEERQWQDEEKNREEECQQLTDELLSASENITPHPFKVLLQQCAARRAAEREGRPYCPPALTSA
jgi:trichoplein keratin filament-binding protein